MTRIFTIYLLLIFSSAWGQEIKSYSGEFPNGTMYPGQATYSYSVAENGSEIKNGLFKYTQNINSDDGNVTNSIQGRFLNGVKSGTWNYSVVYKDWSTGAGNIYATGTIKMTANFEKGIPNGVWIFSENSKSRSKKIVLGGFVWSEYYPAIKQNVTAEYLKGILINNLKMTGIVSGMYKDIQGQLDKKGYCIGNWEFNSLVNKMHFKYYKGIEIEMNMIDKNSGRIISQSNYTDEQATAIKQYADGIKSYSELRELRLRVDTVNFFAAEIVDFSSTFYKPIFLEKYIGGDLSYSDDNSEFRMIPRGVYRVWVDNKSSALISLESFDQYPFTVSIIETNPRTALKSLTSLYDENKNHFTVDDLKEVQSKIDRCNEIIEAELAAAKLENDVKYKKYDFLEWYQKNNPMYNVSQEGVSDFMNRYFEPYFKYMQSKDEYLVDHTLETEVRAKLSWSPGFATSDRYKVEKKLDSLNTLYQIDSLKKSIETDFEENSKLTNLHKNMEKGHIKLILQYNILPTSILSVEGQYKTLKPQIFEAYTEIYHVFEEKFKNTKNISERTILLNDHIDIINKCKLLLESETKPLEKELKKMDNIEDKRIKIMEA